MKNISIFFKDSKPFVQLMGLFFLFVVGLIAAGAIQSLFPVGGKDDSSIRMQLLVQAGAQLLMFFVPALLFAFLFQGSPKNYFMANLQGKFWGLSFVAIVILLLLVPVNDWITYWNENWKLGSLDDLSRGLSNQSKQIMEQLLSLSSFGDVVLQLLVVALVPAICEELFFRGTLQQIFQCWVGNRHLAVIITALIFSVAHGDIYGLVPRFVLGLLLGYFFVLSGSILVNICAHFFNNAVVVLLYLFYHKGVLTASPSEPLQMTWSVVAMCTLAAVALFVVYFIQKGSKQPSKS